MCPEGPSKPDIGKIPTDAPLEGNSLSDARNEFSGPYQVILAITNSPEDYRGGLDDETWAVILERRRHYDERGAHYKSQAYSAGRELKENPAERPEAKKIEQFDALVDEYNQILKDYEGKEKENQGELLKKLFEACQKGLALYG